MTQATDSNGIVTLEEHLAYSDPENPWLQLYFNRVRFPDGSTGYYNRVVEAAGRHGVAILPIHGKHVGLLLQHRYPTDSQMWEIPRGFGESNDPQEDASRELSEESGLVINGDALTSLGSIHPNSGLLSSKVHLFAASFEIGHRPQGKALRNAATFQWFPLKDVLRRATVGEISDAFTLCALFRAQQNELL